MKSRKILNFIAIVAMACSVAYITGCEGPMGPVGPAGPKGDDGTPGVAGNTVCITCHNLTTKSTITTQYDSSVHGKSQIVSGKLLYVYAGQGTSRKACAICHTDEGFIERIYTGQDTIATGLLLPQHIQCQTCHDFHETLDQVNEGPDYALRTKDPVSLLMTNHTTQVDFGNEANLCANCHQPRSAGPVADDDGNAVISSTRYGGHHGPQSTILTGIGGYETVGSLAYPAKESTTHFTSATCVKCHMSNFNHTFEPRLEGCNVAGCHSNLADFDFNGVQTEIQGLMATLEEELKTAGILNASSTPVVGTYPADQVGALYNYLMIEDDRSDGVHNPKYVKALLQNSIEAFN